MKIFDFLQSFNNITVFALVGPSGTGKSFRAKLLADKHGLEAIIDDGLLIQNDKILAGQSAKREKTYMGAVRVALFDDKLSWIGAGENEYDVGTKKVSGIFRQFAGMVPKCNIWNEEYHVIDIPPDVSICTGRAWIATDPSTSVYLCVHQRITAVFRWADGTPRCCHIHISNPYSEMTQEDVGFPTQMGHSAGDSLIRCTADHIGRVFPGRSYRIGGDEFLVIDTELEESAF